MARGFRKLERYFIMGALFSGVMNIFLVWKFTNNRLVPNDSNVPLTLSEMPDEGPTVILKKSTFGQDFYIEVYRKNDIVSAAIEGSYGSWESNQINSLATIYRDYSKEHNIPLEELTFVDIGANIGWYSLSMAALGVNVVAFEPMKENLTLLKHTLSLASNRLIASRITLYEHGLGKSNDKCFIYSDMGNIGDGHVQCKPKESDIVMEDNYKIRGKVDIKRLDDVVPHDDKLSRGPVVAVKMDAEGNEGNIFDGGTMFFLQSDVDVILTEFIPDHIIEKGGDPVNFMTQFLNAGYSAKSLSYDTEYMDSKQMIDMSNFGRDMVAIHSASFKNKTLAEIKARSTYYGMDQGNDTMGDYAEFGGNFDWHEPDSVYYENNSTNPTVKTFNKDTEFAIEVYPSNDIVSNAIRDSYAGWESDTVKTLNNIYQEYSQKHNIPLANLTFVDIGANIGWLSLNMAALGVQVIAFEPMKKNFEMFQSTLKKKMNVEKGISDRIKLYTHGLGIKDETCFLYSDDLNIGGK
jgi:FkbM family methyltransferase